jgi:hypothetical protein
MLRLAADENFNGDIVRGLLFSWPNAASRANGTGRCASCRCEIIPSLQLHGAGLSMSKEHILQEIGRTAFRLVPLASGSGPHARQRELVLAALQDQ